MANEETASPSKPRARKLTWRCKCGKFEFQVTNAPFDALNCHCRYCVTAGKHIAEKYGSNGTSIIGEHGGACAAFYKFSDIDFDAVEEDQVGHVKIGDTGTSVRTFTKCCGTQITMAGGKDFPLGYFRPLNRNCLFEEDGTKYKHTTEPVNAWFGGKAFDNSAVPEPKTKVAGWSFFKVAIPLLFKKVTRLEKNEKYPDHPILMADPATAEVVPKTW
jgi:hypothetical protein